MTAFNPGRPGRASPRPPIPQEPLSPELVLVCPELAAAARAALPDRPWESFAPVVEPVPLSPISLSIAPSAISFVSAARELVPASEPGRVTVQGLPRRRNRAARLPAIMVGLGVAGLLVVSSLPYVPNGPTLGEAATPSPAPRPDAFGVPGGGYVDGGLLSFRIADDGRSALGLTVTTECGGDVARDPVRLDSRGGFRASSRDGRMGVDVVGKMAARSRAEGFVRVRSAGCDTGRRSFVARLS